MKKLFSVLLIFAMLFAFAACNSDQGNTDATDYTGSYEINWQTLPDDDIVGAWTPADPVSDEYVLFTPEGKLRIVKGTRISEADIKFGADDAGNKSAYTQGNYLYGQWTYTVKDGVLTVNLPQFEDGSDTPTSFKEYVFNSFKYTPITLEADKDFTSDEELVGEWTNVKYYDAYKFTEDGYAVYTQTVDDGIYEYDAEIKMTYTVEDGKVIFGYHEDNSGNITTNSVEYSIDGTKLLLAESDYYLNGEGDPAATDSAE